MSDTEEAAPPSDGVPPPEGGTEDWTFPGWGQADHIDDLDGGEVEVSHMGHSHATLGEVPATAICGNDITSSCLYVSALAAIQAGPLAPLALLMVAGVLYLFRFIYAEVGSALPLNGGAYNVLLNTTSKDRAAAAAVLTILSYMATAVISAGEAMHYAHILAEDFHFHFHLLWATVGLLGFFAFLNVVGISESAVVAVGIFAFHMVTLLGLSLLCGWAVLGDSTILVENMNLPRSAWPTPREGIWLVPLFFGFSAAMLGVSGFESSANFIEEQEEGVFPKTLRNMWIAVGIFNPLISLLSMGMLRLSMGEGIPSEFVTHQNSLLAEMARRVGLLIDPVGSTATVLKAWVCVDAVVVLSGAVLTSYVGVTGLVRRMSLDLCLPQFLLSANRWRGTNHWIILSFFALCCSVVWITEGKIELLAGVYTLSFLSVMALFAVGNVMLKMKRDRLPRATRAGGLSIAVALTAVVVALGGNVAINPDYVKVFGIYFFVAGLVVALMFWRVRILLAALLAVEWVIENTIFFNEKLRQMVLDGIGEIRGRAMVFFASSGDPAVLNAAARYAIENESLGILKIVHCYQDGDAVDRDFGESLRYLDRCYPDLRIDLVLVRGEFSPELVEQVSRRLNVPKNYMFIGTPGDHFPHALASLGGVRLIM